MLKKKKCKNIKPQNVRNYKSVNYKKLQNI